MSHDGFGMTEIAILVASHLIAIVLGFTYATVRGRDAIAAANATKTVCASDNEALARSLAAVQQRLLEASARAVAAQAAADAAIKARDAAVAQIHVDTQARVADVREQGHEHADCAQLAHLPVCAAVAGRLWPDHAAGAPADH